MTAARFGRIAALVIIALCMSWSAHADGHAARAAGAVTWYVQADANPAEADGRSWQTTFPFLQDALMLAGVGDEVRVARGMYRPGDFSLRNRPSLGRDYHLKSQAGRWDEQRAAWVRDMVTSPCIDAGNPRSPIMYEPFPHGGVVNMGAYGGTSEASCTSMG